MAEISRKELKQRINKKEYDRIYLIYGEEKMYVKADTDYLVTKLMGKQPPDFNYHTFSKDYTLDEIAVAVQVAPFVSEYNCVKVSDLDFNSLNKDDMEQFTAIMKNVPDTTVLIITMPTLLQEPKKLGANFTKVLNYCKKNGTACAINRETDISLARQIVKWADSRSIKIEQVDAYKLQEYVGDDLYAIKNELDKLCNYVGDGGLITGEHIELLVSKRLEANIFHLTDAIVAGNSVKAFQILDTLFYNRAEPNEIINIIGMAYVDFYRARVGAECAVPMKQIAEEFGYGKRAFVLKNAVAKVRRISTDNLRESLREIVDATSKLRSVSVNGRVLVEMLTAKLILLATDGGKP